MTQDEVMERIKRGVDLLIQSQQFPEIPSEDMDSLVDLGVSFNFQLCNKGEQPLSAESINMFVGFMMAAYNLGTGQDWEVWLE